jgi:hypothetical protein
MIAELASAKPNELSVTYQDVPDGGQIDYAAQDPKLVASFCRLCRQTALRVDV